jgi:hypothetical protein
MATRESKDVANLKEFTRRLKAYLRKQDTFNRGVRNNLKRLNRKAGGKPPSITDPPKPPFKP